MLCIPFCSVYDSEVVRCCSIKYRAVKVTVVLAMVTIQANLVWLSLFSGVLSVRLLAYEWAWIIAIIFTTALMMKATEPTWRVVSISVTMSAYWTSPFTRLPAIHVSRRIPIVVTTLMAVMIFLVVSDSCGYELVKYANSNSPSSSSCLSEAHVSLALVFWF